MASTLRKFAKKHPGLKESTVRLWRDGYKKELKKRVRSLRDDGMMELDMLGVDELPMKKRGRPGEQLDEQVREYLTDRMEL